MKDKKSRKSGKNKNGADKPQLSGVGRRDLMKIGAGAGVVAMTGILHAPQAAAQDTETYAPGMANTRGIAPGGPPFITPHTPTRRVVKYGDFMNTSGRAYGNGPMDDTCRKIVEFASSFKTPDFTDKYMQAVGLMLEDSLGCAISSLNTDSIKIGARVAKNYYPPGQLKSTIWGYGIPTTPEIAGFVGSCMVRHHDNNSEGMHETDMVPPILAIGEAIHASGPDVLSAMTLFWEVFTALIAAKPGPGAPGVRGPSGSIDNTVHAPALAVTVSKMLGLNEDQMANAIALSLTGHISLRVEHLEGVNSMSKSNHDAELARAGVFAALQAKEGMTGPAQIFEGRMGFFDAISGPMQLVLPARVGGSGNRPLPAGDNRYAIETVEYKRIPGNSSASGICETILAHLDEYRKFCSVDEIESTVTEVNQYGDGEDPGKWDPLNSETADHSPYMVARTLIDGDLDVYSFEKAKLTDPAVRKLMGKMTLKEVPGRKGVLFTIRNTKGEELSKTSEPHVPMTADEVHKKFDRNCAYRGVSPEQRDKIRAAWTDLRNVKDISVTIRETLAHYGKVEPI